VKLNPIKTNQNEVILQDGTTVFFSYQTPVAMFVPGTGGVCTKERFSVTTSNHVNQALKRWGATRIDEDPQAFALRLRQLGL